MIGHRLFVLLVNERSHHDVFLQLVGIGMDVVPHDELVEREQTQHRLFDDIPLLLLDNGPAEIGEYQLHVDATLILRQLLQPIQVDSEVLLQKFHQGNVQDDILIALTDDIVVATPAHDVDRQQEDGGVAGLLALGRLIPLDHA